MKRKMKAWAIEGCGKTATIWEETVAPTRAEAWKRAEESVLGVDLEHYRRTKQVRAVCVVVTWVARRRVAGRARGGVMTSAYTLAQQKRENAA